MAELSLTEVAQRYSKNRTTIYRDLKSGKLSRKSNGKFDLAEVIRAYGEVAIKTEQNETSHATSDNDRKIISLLENQIALLTKQLETKDKQIEHLQNLIEYKGTMLHETSNTVASEAISNDTPISNENKEVEPVSMLNNIAPETQKNVTMKHGATSQNVTRKKGLFGRLVKAVLDN